MRALMIDDAVKAQIAQALRDAPTIPHEVLKRYGQKAKASTVGKPLSLADRKRIDDGWQRPPSAEVLIPHGYRLCITREQYPASVVLHLSVSVEGGDLGVVPNMAAVEVLAEECGAKWPPLTGWVEEFGPGQWALNILAEEDGPAALSRS